MQRLVPGWLNSHPLSIRWGLWVLTWGTNTARAGLAQLDPLSIQFAGNATQRTAMQRSVQQCNTACCSTGTCQSEPLPTWTRSGLAVGSLGSALCIERCALSMQRNAVRCNAVRCGANRPILDGTLYETIAAEFHRRRCRALLIAATN